MKILYFDCFSGISGDMAIGALLDLGIDREVFLKELSGLELEGYEIKINTKTANGISGTDVSVLLTDDKHDHKHVHEQGHERDHEHDHEHDHGHEHDHDHDHVHDHGHEHEHDHEHDHEHEHEHDHGHDHHHDHDHGHSHHHEHGHSSGHTHASGERCLADIERILDHSRLSNKVKDFSKRVFKEIAAAEAKVHGKSIEEVHFHEVGAVDSIVDIAGTAICLELLGVNKVISSALHDGSGFIECRHGIIPVPVPAVLEMLKGSGIPLISEEVGTELVTPTGMGLIKCLAESFGSKPPMLVEKTGYGLGKRNTGRLNALRVILGETIEEQIGEKDKADMLMLHKDKNITGSGRDEIIVLETNIDDTTSEILGYTMSKLLEAGALDAFYTSVFMKKSRPAYMLTVLAKPGTEDLMADIILSETSTIGIRTHSMKRYCMERDTVYVDTPYGKARVKIATMGDIKKAAPEYEDCREIAESAGLPLVKVYEIVTAEAAKQHGL